MKHYLAAAAATIALAGAAHADLIDKGNYAGWDLMVDQDLGNGCLIQTDRGDALTRIGFDALKKQGYIAIFNPDWTQLREGETYPLTFDIDGKSRPAQVTGIEVNDVPGAGVTFQQMTVFKLLAKAQTLSVLNDEGTKIFELDLTGTAEALNAARKCQAGKL